jgi:hypothetical protein
MCLRNRSSKCDKRRTQGEGLQPGSPPPPTTPPQPKFKKNTDFVDTLSKVLRELPFRRNQPLKSAHYQYIKILKNKLIKLKKKQEDRPL